MNKTTGALLIASSIAFLVSSLKNLLAKDAPNKEVVESPDGLALSNLELFNSCFCSANMIILFVFGCSAGCRYHFFFHLLSSMLTKTVSTHALTRKCLCNTYTHTHTYIEQDHKLQEDLPHGHV